MSSLLKDIRSDESYKQFRIIFAKAQERLDLDRDLNEALSLHAGRTARKLYGDKQYSVKSLIDATLKDLSFRSRLVEIRVKASIQLSLLEEAVKSLRKYISTEYADDLKEFSTVEQRRNFVDRVVKTPLAFISEGESLLATLDMFVRDIDQSSYHLKNMMECLKLLSESRGKVV